ncbi:hypothetical protein [Komagataeibacter swingsii]|uniref:hypothetical protein n=1 Tax=Komagataeibacter swingsii TaxID=215220 RepID=UPI001ABF8831|nr:hypothetical protein [Komagataeibacter swingsii]
MSRSSDHLRQRDHCGVGFRGTVPQNLRLGEAYQGEQEQRGDDQPGCQMLGCE